MKFDLKDKRAIVTGGGSGIGSAISKTLAANGAQLHILDINKEAAVLLVDEIQAAGGKASPYRCDVANQEEVLKTIGEIGKSTPIDILVNNAGIAHVGNVEQTTAGDFDRVFAINVKGVYNCILGTVPFMKDKGGIILNMASIAGSMGINNRFAYSASKGAVLTMTYSVAKDYIGYGIRCNSISPARIHTPLVDGYLRKNFPGEEKEMFEKLSKTQPIGRMGTPQEVADLALFLCSDEAAFITGTDFPIDGGFIKLNGD
ncbi:glucose 1-dehydrogenase [Flavobacteriaceae bacterium TP-CH-4]|uniref:Glucose 1-dehydrogenase n=1 Tax=Pelagihabitans pacificus TaxID=2696054 RepID=A0A967B3P7_9FLAO|nr:glucose 1-dehydrogenase [Pelagihabitans pacificus]NHF61466.1 glucose 1-dehydrogenase [Pelagihabitans pacificus]